LDLKNFISNYPDIRLAGPKDNEKILRFYDQTPLVGEQIRLRSSRQPDFFKFLKYQSDKCAVLLHQSFEGEVDGVGTVLFRDGYIAGRKTEVAYLADFRIAGYRGVIRSWRSFYSDLIKHLNLPALTAVIDENVRAQRAFVSQKRADFAYDLLTSYQMINVLRKWPWTGFSKAPAEVNVRWALGSDRSRIESFLDVQNRAKPFGYCFVDGELRRRLQVWEGFLVEDFVLGENRQGEIVACFAPWSPGSAKVNVVEKIPFYFQFYRPLINVPRMGTSLDTLYLTHLEVDQKLPRDSRQKIFRALFDFFYSSEIRRQKMWHMISFCDYPATSFKEGLKGYLVNAIPMKLFNVRHREHARLDIKDKAEVGFEIALV